MAHHELEELKGQIEALEFLLGATMGGLAAGNQFALRKFAEVIQGLIKSIPDDIPAAWASGMRAVLNRALVNTQKDIR